MSDEHIEKLEKKFTEGQKVPARVTGFRMMDGLAIVSLKVSPHTDETAAESLLQQEFCEFSFVVFTYFRNLPIVFVYFGICKVTYLTVLYT